MTPARPTYQSIRPADAIQTPSDRTQQNEKEVRLMCDDRKKTYNGRDDGIIESLLDGKVPEGWTVIRSDIDTEDAEGSA